MKPILILVIFYLNLIQFIDPKKFKAIPDEELLSYEIDKSVIDNHETYFDFSNMVFELIDDDMVRVGGYLKAIKTMDQRSLLKASVRTQFLDHASWVDGQLKLVMPNLCAELINPLRFWYNISKLWTKCPPEEGDLWWTDDHIIDMNVDLPASIPIAKWKFFALFTQGLPAFETVKFGMTFQMEFVTLQ